MRIFSFIKRIIGSDEADRIERIDSRISELDQQKRSLDMKLAQSRSTKFLGLSWFKLTPINSRPSKKICTFTPKPLGKVKTMEELADLRRREEEERTNLLQENARMTFKKIRSLIEEEDVNTAETLLYQIASTLNNIKDDIILSDFETYKCRIDNLKKELLQRKIDISEHDRIARAEQEERKRKEEQNELATQNSKIRSEKRRRAQEYEEQLLRDEREDNKRREEIARLRNEVTRKKINAKAFITYLESNGVKCFYHFTSESNLKSIRKYGGLYSWSYCEENGINIPDAGGDEKSRELDRRHGLEDYVRLSFCSDHPMAYRKIKEGASLVLLKIKIDVAAFAETRFSDINAAANDCSHGKTLDDLRRVNIRATQKSYVSRSDGDFGAHQAECMIKTFIPIDYITNINDFKR